MAVVQLLKKLPIDVGQAEKKHDTAGKVIAFSFVKDGEGKAALDIGCRDGYWSEQLKSKGYSVSSLDIEPHYDGALAHNVENGLPYPDNSFDLVWCTEVIEHLHNPKVFLKEIDRVMRPGGQAILTTPNSAWWFYWVVRLWGWTPQKLQNADHKQFFDYRQMTLLGHFRYDVYGYFPYVIKFYRISRLVGWLSPTFILVSRPPLDPRRFGAA